MPCLIQSILLVFTLILSSKMSAKLEYSGETAFEFKQYKNDNNPETIDQNVSGAIQLNSSYDKGKYGRWYLGLFLQGDSKDKNRNTLTVEEANYSLFLNEQEDTKILLGYNVYSWSIMEAFHLVDNINSIHYTSHSENLKKRGELALELERTFNSGSLSFYFFPKFETPVLPGKESRVGLNVDFASPVIIHNQKIKEDGILPQFGMRLTREKNISFSLYSFYHIDRHAPLYGTHKYQVVNPDDDEDEDLDDIPIDLPLVDDRQEEKEKEGCSPCYFPDNIKAFKTAPTPYYFGVLETGATLEWFYLDTTFKFEGVWKKFTDYKKILGYQQSSSESKTPSFTADAFKKREDHIHIAFGTEKLFSLFDGQDTTFYLELVGIGGVSKEQRGELSIFQRDVFFGIKHNFNDTMGKELALGLINDWERSESFVRARYSQRLSDEWKVKMGMEFYHAPRERLVQSGFESQDQDHNIFFKLKRYF